MPPGCRLDDGEAEVGGDGAVLAFRVDDGQVAVGAVDGLQAADERLDGGRLAEADRAHDDHVRVRQMTLGVELERVEVEPATSRR